MNTQHATTAAALEDIPSDLTQRWEWIKFQLRLRGSSLSAVAREQGVTRQAARNALTRAYPRMERAIADKIGVAPQYLWPDRWTADGHRALRPGRKRQNIAVKDTAKRATRNGGRDAA